MRLTIFHSGQKLLLAIGTQLSPVAFHTGFAALMPAGAAWRHLVHLATGLRHGDGGKGGMLPAMG
jgi:hypothetical protein